MNTILTIACAALIAPFIYYLARVVLVIIDGIYAELKRGNK
jgi:hypothetical protein